MICKKKSQAVRKPPAETTKREFAEQGEEKVQEGFRMRDNKWFQFLFFLVLFTFVFSTVFSAVALAANEASAAGSNVDIHSGKALPDNRTESLPSLIFSGLLMLSGILILARPQKKKAK